MKGKEGEATEGELVARAFIVVLVGLRWAGIHSQGRRENVEEGEEVVLPAG